MPSFLMEIGVEELPSSFVRQALSSIETQVATLLAQHRLDAKVKTMGTARRLAMRLDDLPAGQPDRSETLQGPLWSVAFKDGEPTKAAIGFAKKNGVSVDALKKVPGEKGDYAAVQVEEKGKPTAEVLQQLLPELCQRISFPKSMRWGEGDFAFGRPIHWVLSLLEDAIVPFELAGVAAGRRTRGHRFLAPAELDVAHVDAYESKLAAAKVIVDLDARREQMHAALQAAAKELGGELVEDDFLVHECATLVEQPAIVPGRFDEAFLELPEAVVISVMRDHQRYFAVRGPDGLLPRYLNVVNTAEDPERIALGNDRVLRARLKDAEFFVREDRKVVQSEGFEPWRKKLDSVVFQRKLGTVGDKVRRIEALANEFAGTFGVEPAAASRAAYLCKVDLESLIVFEFPELQGAMGAFYAEHAGESPDVVAAVEQHYRPAGAADDVANTRLGALIAVADRIDTLVGCFGTGLVPKGNADPFGLRRAALGVLRTALEGPSDFDWHWLIDSARNQYQLSNPKFGDQNLLRPLNEFFYTRAEHFFRQAYPTDVVRACIQAWTGIGSDYHERSDERRGVRDLRKRIEAVEAFRQTDAYEPLAVGFKRAFNISRDVRTRDVDAALLEKGFEAGLAEKFESLRPGIESATERGDYGEALTSVAELRASIDAYFDNVFVMVDDETLRNNRLALLGRIADCVSRIVHFHLLQPAPQ